MNEIHTPHNKRDFNTALNELRAVRMSPNERATIRGRIDTTAPAHTGAEKIVGTTRTAGGAYRSPFVSFRNMVGVLGALFLLAAGAFVTASERALPGDRLYDLKTGLVEPLRAALSIPGEEFALTQAKLVDVRLHEAETLATAGELNDAKREQIEALLDRHTVALNQALDEVAIRESPDKANAITRAIQGSMALHTRILSQFVAVASTTVSRETLDAADKLRAQADLHVRNPKSLWTLPPPATTSADFILENVKGADMQAGAGAAGKGSLDAGTPDKLPREQIDAASHKPNPALLKKKIK